MQGDLGTNWFTGEEITTELSDRIPVTLGLAFGGLLLGVVIGCSLGVLAALKAGRWQDRVITVIASLGIAMPSFGSRCSWRTTSRSSFVGSRPFGPGWARRHWGVG